jgi:hypothetical protein
VIASGSSPSRCHRTHAPRRDSRQQRQLEERGQWVRDERMLDGAVNDFALHKAGISRFVRALSAAVKRFDF